MARTISARANEPQASFVDGPLLIAKQPSTSTTVIIAVVGTYKRRTTPQQQTPDKHPQHDTFLALLSTENHPELDHPTTEQHESDEQLQQRRSDEKYLIDVRQSRYCGRYLDLLLQRHPRRLYRNAEHFCATGGKCFHGPAPSTFPGNKNWTFALGEGKLDDDDDERMRGHQRRRRLRMVEGLAPEESEADRALRVLGDMLRAAVSAGLGDLKVVVSVSDTSELPLASRRHAHAGGHDGLLQRLTSRVFDAVIGWVEEGWVARDSLEIVWRPFGVTRRFGVLGSEGAFPFVYYDEEEETL